MERGTPDPAIVGLLASLGATEQQIASAAAVGRLPALAVDLVLTRDFTLPVAEVAERFGTSVDELVETYRLLGIPLDPSGPALGEGDLALLAVLSLAGGTPSAPESITSLSQAAGENLLRVIGMSIGRIADASVSTFVQDVEEQLEIEAGELIEWVRAETNIGELAHLVAPSLGTLFLHHLLGAIQRQRQSQDGVRERVMARLAIGFVDLVGFTPLSRHLSSQELVNLVTRFEQRAFDIVSAGDGRVVKHIGDEVMYSALTADAAAGIALALVAEFGGAVQPRAGLSFGEVLTLRGDFYGPVVNLAARLTDQAVPGEVLIDAATAAYLTTVSHQPGGRRQLKGFDEPVAVSSLISA